ncbi:MAG: alpha amylase C-terminal domain-containing protein [Bacteroidales bacterium]|jgi:1,4-alpha-glucan branching enzyme|nr:alpha amylase C-terminal domain-containing protein [Bacteroidales bacterium]
MSDSEPFFEIDTWLRPYRSVIESRYGKFLAREQILAGNSGLRQFALGYLWYGLHRTGSGWVFREHAPGADAIFLVGTFSNWTEDEKYRLRRIENPGDWEIVLAGESLCHGDLFRLSIHWKDGKGERIPAYVHRLFQDEETKIFSAQVWDPPAPYTWKTEKFTPPGGAPLIYEAHAGMATEEEKTGSFREFTHNVLPRIAEQGYNTLQLMAVQEHPFYGSFGYHVSSFFAVSSRFGTPEDLKELIDTAHEYGIRVIMDIIHSHSVRNVNEGLAILDGNPGLYFHTGERRLHKAWDSLCFDYGKDHVVHFLLSNCAWWLSEYRFDGFRFDGVTSMIYFDHGLNRDFLSYSEYYDGGQDEDAITYLALANRLIHEINPLAITVAEEMSGMPGIAAPLDKMGYGFDYRMAMGVPDYWIKLVKDVPDEQWNLGRLFFELKQKRPEEKVISYSESHDQALVGDKTLIFRMIDAEMYTSMARNSQSLVVDRGVALHKMIKLITFGTSGGGYLNFMGNEFGHPEWIDFPREGNNWSFRYARRQWSLRDNHELRYCLLARFDRDMVQLQHKHWVLDNSNIESIMENDHDKVVAFARGDLLFVFNFHPANSYSGYGIRTKGRYEVVLDTDDERFGGFNRIDKSIIYASSAPGGQSSLKMGFWLHLYLPARTGIVLHRLPVKGIHNLP